MSFEKGEIRAASSVKFHRSGMCRRRRGNERLKAADGVLYVKGIVVISKSLELGNGP